MVSREGDPRGAKSVPRAGAEDSRGHRQEGGQKCRSRSRAEHHEDRPEKSAAATATVGVGSGERPIERRDEVNSAVVGREGEAG